MSSVWVIVLVGLASFLPRYLPLAVLGDRRLPPAAQDALGYAPPAVLAALVVPMILMPTGSPESPGAVAPYLAGGAAAALTGAWSKRFLRSAAAGMVVFSVVRAIAAL